MGDGNPSGFEYCWRAHGAGGDRGGVGDEDRAAISTASHSKSVSALGSSLAEAEASAFFLACSSRRLRGVALVRLLSGSAPSHAF